MSFQGLMIRIPLEVPFPGYRDRNEDPLEFDACKFEPLNDHLVMPYFLIEVCHHGLCGV